MNIRRRFEPWLSAALCILFAVTARAANGTWSLTGAAATEYFFRGVRQSGLSLQPYVEYTQGPTTAGIWAITPLRDRVAGQSDPEIDPYGSYRMALSPACTLQPGFTLYTFPRAESRNGFYRVTFEPNLALNWTVRGLTLTPKVYYDIVLEGATYELNAAFAYPVKQIGTEIDLYASVGTYEWRSAVNDAPSDVRARGDYWTATAALPFQITTRGRITASVGYAQGSNNYFKTGGAPKIANPNATGRVVAMLSWTVTY
jgi:hypothetical protein